MLKLRLVRHHPCSSVVENLGRKGRTRKVKRLSEKSSWPHGRRRKKKFCRRICKLCISSLFLGVIRRESLTVGGSVKAEVPAAPEQVTTARAVIPAAAEGVPCTGGNCWCQVPRVETGM